MHLRVTVATVCLLIMITWALPAPDAVAAGSHGEMLPSGPHTGTTARGIVKAADILHALQQGQKDLDYHGQTVQGDLDLFKLTAGRRPSGKTERVVNTRLNFRGTVFEGGIFTWDQKKEQREQPPVRFTAEVDFLGARFLDHVNFDDAIFEAKAKFVDARFHKMASFWGTTFEQRVSFRSAQFDERALFRKTVFRGETDFAIATFNWIAFFPESTFCHSEKGANFLYTRFNDEANFVEANFKGIAKFVSTRFHGRAYFADAKFEDQAWFTGGARFDDIVTFRRAQFRRTDFVTKEGSPTARAPVFFHGVTFSGDANFADAQFNHVAFGQVEGLRTEIGMDTIFRRRVDFRRAKFRSIDLRRVSFQSDVDFSAADLGDQVDVTDVDIATGSLQMTWDQLLKKEDGKQKFLWQGVFKEAELREGDDRDRSRSKFFDFLARIEKGFRESGQLRDAGEVHYLAEDLKRQGKSGLRYLADTIFFKLGYGYGVSPLNQVYIALFFIVGCGFFYMPRGALRYEEQRTLRLRRITEIPVDWSGRSGDAPDPSGKSDHPGSLSWCYLRGLWFSSYVFTKIGFGGLVARKGYAGVVIAEWLIGLLVWVVFLMNLSKRWPLLHQLVTMAPW